MHSFQNHYSKKIHFKIAPSENAFQKCYFGSIVIEGIRTLLFFSQKNLERNKYKFDFKTNQKLY